MVVFGGDGKTWWSYWVFLLRAVLNGGRRSGRSHRNSTDQKLHVLFLLNDNKVEQGRTMEICAHGQTGTSHNIFTCPEATRMRQSSTVTGKGFICEESNCLCVEVAKSRLLLFRLRQPNGSIQLCRYDIISLTIYVDLLLCY